MKPIRMLTDVVKSVSAMLTYNDVTVSVSELIGAGQQCC